MRVCQQMDRSRRARDGTRGKEAKGAYDEEQRAQKLCDARLVELGVLQFGEADELLDVIRVAFGGRRSKHARDFAVVVG